MPNDKPRQAGWVGGAVLATIATLLAALTQATIKSYH
jgi:hypothetical protein